MAEKKRKKLVMPKSMGQCADLFYKLRAARLLAQNAVNDLEKDEAELREHIINNLPKSQASGAAGKVARAQIVPSYEPQVDDWDKFYAHMSRKKEFDLMNRAINRKAIKERWDNGKEVPGVKKFKVVKLSVTKL